MEIEQLINAMTMEEKCAMLVGQNSWDTKEYLNHGIRSIKMADGPHGLRKQLETSNSISVEESFPSVCFPPAVTVACSFDPKLSFDMGEAIANECLAMDVDVLLGPGINIKRNPLCGRNFEYYSEDPYLTSEIAKGFVKGVQSRKVGACIKHFALNQQESFRMVSSSIADERAFFEIYLKAFKNVLDADPDMVMCSYNRVNDVYASENKVLLDDILRKQFGFNKVIVSDWTAVSSRTNALKATLDLEMPGYIYSVHRLLKNVKNGKITEEEINASVKRILTLVKSKERVKKTTVNLEDNHQIARKIARESMVLLKNDEQILPLNKNDSLAVIGHLAKDMRYQGGGSSHINSYKVESIIQALPNEIDLGYAEGYLLDGDGYSESLLEAAMKLAKTKSKVLLVVGLTDEYESEGYDRTHLNLPKGHLELIKAVSSVNANIIVVLQIGSPVVMPWLSQVKAVLNCYLGGEAGALALVDLLYGKHNPSGRLAETFPLHLEDVPSTKRFAKGNNRVYYQESIYVGYRYFQSIEKDVLFPFGYGLSYTTFDYYDLVLDKNKLTLPGKIEVSVKVKNTGKVKGKEVIQLYIENNQDKLFKAKLELRQFKKIDLSPNEEKTVKFILSQSDFEYYDVSSHSFVCDEGIYKIQIRKNARDGLCEETIHINTKNPIGVLAHYEKAYSYYIKNGLTFLDEDFEKLINMPLNNESIVHHRPFNLDNNVFDIEKSWIGKMLKKQLLKSSAKALEGKTLEYRLMVEKSLLEVPLRSIVIFSGGLIKMHTMKGLVALCNYQPLKAIKYFFGRD